MMMMMMEEDNELRSHSNESLLQTFVLECISAAEVITAAAKPSCSPGFNLLNSMRVTTIFEHHSQLSWAFRSSAHACRWHCQQHQEENLCSCKSNSGNGQTETPTHRHLWEEMCLEPGSSGHVATGLKWKTKPWRPYSSQTTTNHDLPQKRTSLKNRMDMNEQYTHA